LKDNKKFKIIDEKMKKKRQQIEITIHEISCHSTTLPYKIETDYQKKKSTDHF